MQTFDPGTPLYRPRPELLAELRDPAEQSGLLNRVIPQMLHFLSGGAPTSTPSMDEAIEEFIEATDDFGAWLATQIKTDPLGGFVATSDVSIRWKNRQERRRMPGHVTWRAIARAMSERFPNAVSTQQRTGGTGVGGALTKATGSVRGAPRRGYSGVSWVQPW
jgi:hypothetical protein